MVKTATQTIDSPERLAALHNLRLLDSPSEAAFDRLSKLAARILHTPVALVSLVDRDRQFFKSCLGLPEPWQSWRETPLSHSFCQHVVTSAAPLVVEDARQDERLRDNPAIRDLGAIAYLGIPLSLPDGQVIGSFCVIDTRPHRWSEQDIGIVRDLAASVMSEIELRALHADIDRQVQDKTGELRRREQQYRDLVESSLDLICTHDLQGRLLSVNRRGAETLGYTAEELVGRNLRTLLLPEYQNDFDAYLERVQREGRADGLMRVRSKSGEPRIWSYQNSLRSEDAVTPVVRGTAHDVTQAITATHQLQASEARFRATFEQAAVGIAHVAPDGRWLLVNQKLCDIVGYTREEMFTRTYQDITYPDDLDADLAQVKQILAGSLQTYSMEKRYVRKDGRVVWINLTVSLVRDAHDSPDYFIAVVEDIDRRRQIETALHERTEIFKLFVEHSPAAMVMLDAQLRYMVVSRRWLADYGLDDRPVLGRHHYEIFPEIPQRWKEIHKRCLAGATERSDREAFVRADGHTDWIKWEIRPWRRADGQIGGIIIFSELITERVLSEQALADSEEKFRTLTEHSPVGIFMDDASGKAIYINDRCAELVGVAPQQALELDWVPLIHPEDRERVTSSWGRAVTNAETFKEDYRWVHPDGSVVWTAGEIIPVRDSQGQVRLFIGTLVEITALKSGEQEREHLINELTARNMEMENFVYTISHDLKSPLITIGGFTTLLEKDIARGEKAAVTDSLAEIKKAVATMQDHIRDLLLLSRTGRVKSELADVSLATLLKEVLDQFNQRLQGEEVRLVVAADLPAIRVDRKGFHRVFTNLIDNAFNYRRPGIALQIELGWQQDADELRLYVRDNGRGIKPEFQSRIFGLFQRADSSTEGSGVGLAISKRVIEVHGGRLWVESIPGQGSTFWIGLPAAVVVSHVGEHS